MPSIRRALTVIAAVGLVWGVVGCSDSDPAKSTGPTTTSRPRYGRGVDRSKPREPAPKLTLTAVSTRAELVSGDDVLVRVVVPPSEDADRLRLSARGKDLTGQLHGRGRRRLALVTGLANGSSTIRARVGDLEAELDVVNHPITGPVISGPHLPLFQCSTEQFDLGPPTDADCSAPTVVDYRYIRRTGDTGNFVDLPDPAHVPADVAVVTIAGKKVPLVVRRERGVINRGVYTFTVLDPTPGQPPPLEQDEMVPPDESGTGTTEPGATTTTAPGSTTTTTTPSPSAGGSTTTLPPDGAAVPDPRTPAERAAADVRGLAWNKRLVWRFGGGCGTTYSQGDDGATAEDIGLLSRGYAVASSTFTTFQTHCNDVLAAETVMMAKEHIIEELGPVEATIGQGLSGGAIQQHMIVQNYPGLLDAAAAGAPFPDAASISAGVTDCGLLGRYYGTPDGSKLSEQQRAAVNGMSTTATCDAWASGFLEAIRPEDGCPAVPEQLRYDPDVRRGGIRCTLTDANVNSLGVDLQSGFGNRALDNVGVQYGLKALEARTITVEQFLDLNEAIGGYDVDGNFMSARSAADASAIVTAYAGGRVSSGGGDQRVAPIIDINLYQEGDIHDRFRAFSLRERLRLPDGRPAPNHVIWTRRPTDPALPATAENPFAADFMVQAVEALDRWVSAAHDDDEGGNRAEIVARNRPADVQDECIGPDGKPVRGPDVYTNGGPCDTGFPIYGDPRIAAGEPLADDILKCTLVPLDPNDYGAGMGTAQLSRLRRTFPGGVCDWSKPGIGQIELSGTWLSYAHGLPFNTQHLLDRAAQSDVTGRDDDETTGTGSG